MGMCEIGRVCTRWGAECCVRGRAHACGRGYELGGGGGAWRCPDSWVLWACVGCALTCAFCWCFSNMTVLTQACLQGGALSSCISKHLRDAAAATPCNTPPPLGATRPLAPSMGTGPTTAHPARQHWEETQASAVLGAQWLPRGPPFSATPCFTGSVSVALASRGISGWV